jgi:glycosyltransferase involved in cell wall biosynthesis
MIRICTSLTNAGYKVTLIGFKRKNSKPLSERPYGQVRIPVLAEQGKLLYGGYWLMLFFYLLFKRCDALCAIDLDTILPVYLVSLIRNKRRVYDAHELFTELKEVVTKPREKKIWDWIERTTIPNFHHNYTVGDFCSLYFMEKYGKQFAVVRNATVLQPLIIPEKKEKYILYQGWVNEGRCFEELIPAMQQVDAKLVVCGEGNFFRQAKELAIQHNVQDKISFKGFVPPQELKEYTQNAYIGLTLFHAISKSNEYSLANRFFDYMHNGVPQVCMNFPEYRKVNEEYEIAALVNEPMTPDDIAAALNKLLNDTEYYNTLQQNCLLAREKYCWQHEEKTLLHVYEQVFNHKKKRF